MKLLFVAYELDEESTVLGWQARVLAALAERVEHVTAYADVVGATPSLANVDLHVIPRRPLGLPRRAGGGLVAAREIGQRAIAAGVDACVVHMAHHWAWRLRPFLSRIPIVLWYAHGSVSPSLRLAHRAAERIVTSSPDGFRLRSHKVRVIGQAIDTDLFHPRHDGDRVSVITVGRISRRKRVDRMLEVGRALDAIGAPPAVRLRLVGPVLTEDDRRLVAELASDLEALRHRVELSGPMTAAEIVLLHASAFAHLNLSETGSMDKSVLEALACGVPVLTSNEAFRAMLSGAHGPMALSSESTPQQIASRLMELHARRRELPSGELRDLIVGHHDLPSYADRLLEVVEEVLA